RGHEVRRELDAREAGVQGAGEDADEERLRVAGHTLQERVPAREEGDERLVDHLVLSDHARGDLLPNARQLLRKDFRRHGFRVRSMLRMAVATAAGSGFAPSWPSAAETVAMSGARSGWRRARASRYAASSWGAPYPPWRRRSPRTSRRADRSTAPTVS